MEQLFESPYGKGLTPEKTTSGGNRYTHFPSEGAQVHIGLMTPVPTFTSEHYYEIAAAVSVLSGSMSSRLFTEVREKRGLCYAIGATYKSLKDYAGISCYAGTTPDKAQETVDVITEQFRTLKDGISDDEIQRAKVGLKTSLIMQIESTSARSAGIAGDYFMLNRVRNLDEIRDKIESLTVDSVLDFLQNHLFEEFTVVTLGPNAVTI
jgi:predicted Zn-dependent peptidase